MHSVAHFETKKSGLSFLALALAVISLSACSMEASLTKLGSIEDPTLSSQRTKPDFVTGEIVTTSNGVVVKGTFGEISEKKVLSSGVEVDGAFYE